MNKDNLELILEHQKIQNKVQEIAKIIEKKYQNKNPIIIGIMKGSLYFLADLTNNLNIDLEIDTMSLSSYGKNHKSSGKVKITKDLDIDIENRNIIIVEDIIDSGTTLRYLKNYFKNQKIKSVMTISMFCKKANIDADVDVDLIGFELPNCFLVGYGLDYANKYRHLKDVYGVININLERG